MSTDTTFVLQDVSLIADLCGENDANVRYIEKLLDAPVYVRGNALQLASDVRSLQRVFVCLCEALVENIQESRTICADLIRELYEEILDETPKHLQNISIYIPHLDTAIYPRTAGQRAYIASMQSSTLCIVNGPAGSGKTYLAVAQALSCIFNKSVRRLVMTRPVVEAGESLGFLPGDLSQKIAPYLYPLFDVLSALVPASDMERLEKQKMLEMAPLAYMRGRNLDNSFIILDEAQNVTREQMKMFLTRIGQNSIAVIAGDATQCDIPSERSTLKRSIELLAPVEGVSTIHLTKDDVIRSGFVKRIVQLYDETNI